MREQDVGVALVLEGLGIPVESLEEFDGRKVLQKVVYLMQELPSRWGFGYRFSLYIRGPYSPALADSAYRLLDDDTKDISEGVELVDGCREDLRRLKAAFPGAWNGLDPDLLELAATMHFLVTRTYSYVSGVDERQESAKEWVEETKPHLGGDFGRALAALRKLGVAQGDPGSR